jgi:hypothetical protein
MTTSRTIRSALYAVATLAMLLGLWGIASNIALPFAYEKRRWNFFEPFEFWDESAASSRPPTSHRFPRDPWWALSFQTPCPYLDPCLAGPIGDGFYALCLSWGLGTFVVLTWCWRFVSGKATWAMFLFWGWCLVCAIAVIAHLAFFASVVIEARQAGLC